MKLAPKILFLVGLVFISAGNLPAQWNITGTPPFSSQGGGPTDVIDKSNLNIHLTIPVLHKPGRGTPFDYVVTYDSFIWQPPSVSGQATWYPAGPGASNSTGWFLPGPGYLKGFAQNAGYCYTDIYPTGGIVESSEVYYDPLGTPHAFPGYVITYWGTCGSGTSPYTGTTTDGSGYTLTVTSGGSGTLTAKNGEYIVGANSSAPVSTDSNGNEITVSSGGVFTDTLGQTALTLAGSGTPSSPTTLTYTAPSGANAVYTVKYTAYTVKTNFGCSGISEYGPISQNLVSEIDLPDGSKYTFTYEATPGYSGDVTGRIKSVTLPTGGTINYTYTGVNNGIVCTDGSTRGLTRQTPDGTWTYSRTLGSGAATSTNITDPQGNLTVMNFQGIYPTQSQVYQGSSTLLKTTYTCYNGATAPCNSTSIALPITRRTVTTQWPGTGGQQSKTDAFYNSYGLGTETDEYAYGPGAPGSLARKTLTTYAGLGNGIVDRPATVTVQDASGNVKAQTTYSYDQTAVTATSGTPQHITITGSRGNLTTVSYLVSGSTTLTKTFTYYDTGNVQTATDVNSAQTSYTYGACGNSFPTLISEPIGSMTESMAWNCTGGVLTSVTDENSKTTTYTWNDADFWRIGAITDPLGNILSYYYQPNPTYSAPPEVASWMTFGNSIVSDYQYKDGLGRTYTDQRLEAPGGSTLDTVSYTFDSNGRPHSVSQPCATGYTGTCSTAQTTQTYDTLNRPVQTTDGGGGTLTLSYSQNDTYVTAGPAPTGENTKRKQLEYDALGRLTSVCEITGAIGSGTCGQTSSQTGYWTKYTYDPTNNLTGVTQNAQAGSTQTRTFGYDDLGRMTSEANPESGTTTYTYDTDATCGTSRGDLVKNVDAVGNVTCFAYDALHRPTSVTYPSGSYASVTPKKYFVYDSATVNGVAMANAKTRVAEAYTCFSPCTTKLTDTGFSYTARGEVSDVYESTPHSGGYYHVTQTYWANGATNQISGLAGLPTITYNLDGEGRVYSATASSGQNPLSSTTYNVASLPTAINLGSSDSDSFAYDQNTNRMTQYRFNVNAQSLIGNLTWNALGTLSTLLVTDPFNSSNTQSCSYTHDDLVRIASANCGSIWSQTFNYDAFGNITKTGNPGNSFQPTYSTATNRMTQIGGSTPSYDANGNVTNDFLHTYSWDSNGRPVTIDTVGIIYDALGRMVEQNRSGAYTQIVYAPSGGKLALMNGSTLQKGFVPLTGGAMAVYNSSGLAYYRHSDWLGSSRLASTPARTIYSDGAYAPFGEPYAQTGATDLSFTGMNQDTVSNLYDFPAREYGIQGRWPSPDPAGVSSIHLGDPQTLNRYAYVRNNPLALTDPTGLDGSDDCGSGDASDCNGPGMGGFSMPDASIGGWSFSYSDTTGTAGYVPGAYVGAPGPGSPTFGNVGTDELGMMTGDQMLGKDTDPKSISNGGANFSVGQWYWQSASEEGKDSRTGTSTYWPDGWWVRREDNGCDIGDDCYIRAFAGMAGSLADAQLKSAVLNMALIDVSVAGAAAYSPAQARAIIQWLFEHREDVSDCIIGAISPTPGGPGVWGNVCNVGSTGGKELYNKYKTGVWQP